ncbi:MAG: class I SAM-dependent methyltransferase [Burkholderiaceae bacterium]|nr:class I SAM-dependent methyltransferase [Burkholderiaceae bacterium]
MHQGQDVTIPFETLAAEIREKARSLRSENPDPHSLLEDDWQQLQPGRLEQFRIRQSTSRGQLLQFSGNDVVSAVYRMVLKREADAEGLRIYRSLMDSGAHPYLIAGLLGISREARELGATSAEFALYRLLAYVLKFQRVVPGLRRLIFALARRFAGASRKADQQQFWLDQVAAMSTSLTGWHAVLTRQNEMLAAMDHRIERTNQSIRQAHEQFSTATARINMRMLSAEARGQSQDFAQAPGESPSDPKLAAELDRYYLAFEDSHRGNAEQMRERYKPYMLELNRIKQSSVSNKPFLDLGCGRGEWLEFVAAQGITAQGIDLNPVMVKQAVDKGLHARESDLISALRGHADGSLAGVSAFHVIEHLPFAVLFECVAQAWRVLAEGGMLIFETPNPENLMVATHTFYHDHTHRNPLTPSSMQFLLQYWGFKEVSIKRLNPYPEKDRVPGEDLLTERFNGHFCGPQDFAVIGIK